MCSLSLALPLLFFMNANYVFTALYRRSGEVTVREDLCSPSDHSEDRSDSEALQKAANKVPQWLYILIRSIELMYLRQRGECRGTHVNKLTTPSKPSVFWNIGPTAKDGGQGRTSALATAPHLGEWTYKRVLCRNTKYRQRHGTAWRELREHSCAAGRLISAQKRRSGKH